MGLAYRGGRRRGVHLLFAAVAVGLGRRLRQSWSGVTEVTGNIAQTIQDAPAAVAPLLKEVEPFMQPTAPGGVGDGNTLNVLSRNSTDINTTTTDQSVRNFYADNRVIASDGSTVFGTESNVSGMQDPNAFKFGGEVANRAIDAVSPATASSGGGSAGAFIQPTVAAAVRSGLPVWALPAMIGAAVLVLVLVMRRSK